MKSQAIDSSRGGWLARARWTFRILMAAVAAAWLMDANGVSLPVGASRGLVAACGLAGALWLGLAVARLVQRRAGEPLFTPGRVLLVLVVVSFVVKLAGIDFEPVDHYASDEGVFLTTAERINAGDLLPATFNYGHFLFYASALVLWTQGLFAELFRTAAQALYGVESDFEVSRILLRSLTACLGALTVIPVYVVGRRVAGAFAGALAGALIALLPLYNQVAHLVISDVPSGFFAALTLMYVARLLDGENLGDYLLAGVAAGLAAGSKYPAGVVAVGIIGIWVYWRLRSRRFSWYLLWPGLASLAAFLAIMPAIWLSPESVFVGEGLDITFGYRQYALGGWVGKMPTSVPLWYCRKLVDSFGMPALLLGILGIVFLAPEVRRRLMGVLPFPVVYLGLIFSMNMVGEHTLQPVLPALAAVLGVGASAWRPHLSELRPAARRYAPALLAVVCLVIPATRTLAWDLGRTRPGTRQQAAAWIEENILWGAAFVKEAYTPTLDRGRYTWVEPRYAARLPMEQLRDPAWDYLLLSTGAHIRFFKKQRGEKPYMEAFRRSYEEMFTYDLVREFRPGLTRSGPLLKIYRLDPERIDYASRRRYRKRDAAFVSHPDVEALSRGGPLRFTMPDRSVLFKGHFEPGRYRINLLGPSGQPRGLLEVLTRDNRKIASLALAERIAMTLPEREKYFFRLSPEPGWQLSEMRVVKLEGEGQAKTEGYTP